MSEAPEVSVAVATRNRSPLLGELLESLRGQTLEPHRFEVVVVDDGSQDETPAMLARERERGDLMLRVIRREEAGGPAAARNDAWRAARSPLVAFTDDDCVATPSWLEAGLEAARDAPGTIIQGRTDPRPDQLYRHSPFSRTQEVHSAGPLYETCNIFYPRAVLQELGGFAEATYKLPAGEDTDLAWRALERGVRTAYAPEALVEHAVLFVGPIGMLRHALRWHTAIPVFARHPGLRRAHLHRGVFWSKRHEELLRFLLGLALVRRSRVAALVVAWPYARRLVWRRSGPLLAPYIVVHDLVEMGSVIRGAIRSRVLVV